MKKSFGNVAARHPREKWWYPRVQRQFTGDWGWLRHLPLHLLLSSEAKAVEYGVAPCTVSIWMLALVLQLKAIVWVRPKFYTGSTGISWNCGVFSRCYSSGPFTLCHKQCWRGLPNHSVTHSLASNMLLRLVEQLELVHGMSILKWSICLEWDPTWLSQLCLVPLSYSLFKQISVYITSLNELQGLAFRNSTSILWRQKGQCNADLVHWLVATFTRMWPGTSKICCGKFKKGNQGWCNFSEVALPLSLVVQVSE